MDRYPLDHILQSNTGMDQDGFDQELFHDIHGLDGVSAVPIEPGRLIRHDGTPHIFDVDRPFPFLTIYQRILLKEGWALAPTLLHVRE